MRKINYKSDFDFVLRLKDANNGEVGFPDYPWSAYVVNLNNGRKYFISSKKNSFDDNGMIHVVCNNHGLGVGRLGIEFFANIPNKIYPDGAELIVTPTDIEIELVSGQGDEPTQAEIDALLPYIKGRDMVYSDLTEEEKNDLARRMNATFSFDEETATLYINTKDYEL